MREEASQAQATAPNEIYVARQAILDRAQKLFAYELLYRSSLKNAFDGVDATTATSRVISNSFLTIGMERLIGNRRAFVNFDRDMLVSGYADVLPSKSVVVEILEDVEPEPDVLEACRDLKQKGYLLALDDFVSEEGYEPFVELADIIKVDFRLASPAAQACLGKRYASRGIKMLAEKVETQEEFQKARAMDYSLFQGYFFSKPAIVSGKEVPGFKLNYLRILKEINHPALDFNKIEEIVKYEASLVHKLLLLINSASFGWNKEIDSIRHALALLGEKEVRKWISLISLTGLAGDKPRELVMNAVVRGRVSELISSRIGMQSRQSEFFLMGMFSLLSAILDAPMVDLLSEVHLSDDVKDALLGSKCRTRGFKETLDLICAYELADWGSVNSVASSIGLSPDYVAETYLDSVEWADRIFES